MKTSNNIPFLAAVLIGLAKAGPLTVSWGISLNSGEEILSVNHEGSVISSSCSSKLSFGEVDVAVAADTEANGSLTIGGKKYDLSNDALCNAKWNEDFAQVLCEIPFEGKVVSSGLITTGECFPSASEEEMGDILDFIDEDGMILEPVEESSKDLEDVTEWFEVSANPQSAEETGLVDKRQVISNCTARTTRKRRNPANATKHTRHTQLTDSLECKLGTCGTAHGKTWSTSHAATISITAPWASAGYSVTKTKGGSTTLSCDGNKGSTVCVKQRQAYQRYDVTEVTDYVWSTGGSCGIGGSTRNYSIRSPMSAKKYTKYYCGRGTSECTWEGRTGWRDNGKGAWTG